MPNRILKESICYSDDIDSLTAFEETVFYRLLVRADDYGRMDARPAFLCSQLFATRTDIAEAQLIAAIGRLAEVGLIARYTVGDKPYLYIAGWQKHQKLRTLRQKYPAPPEQAPTNEAPQQSAAACGNLRQAVTACNKPLQTVAHAGAESETESESESGVEDEDEAKTESGSKPKSGPGRFIPPTVTQVADYCTRRKNGVSAQRFVDFYASKGWLVGHSPMTDWRAAVRRWKAGDTGAARASPAAAGGLSTAKNYESEDCI